MKMFYFFNNIMRKIVNRAKQVSNVDLFKMIDPNTEIVVIAPWNGKPIPVTIRILDSVSLNSCGEFNTISGIIKEKTTEADIEDVLKAKNIHENMLKLALVHPTFDELQEHLEAKDFNINVKKQIKEIKELISTLDSEVDKNDHNKMLNRLELSISFLIPEDFTAYIVTILMQQEATDINKLTRETLLTAGFLGEKYNTRPSKYLEGTFTEKQNVDIDITALTLVSDYREDKKVSTASMKWIRGGKK